MFFMFHFRPRYLSKMLYIILAFVKLIILTIKSTYVKKINLN